MKSLTMWRDNPNRFARTEVVIGIDRRWRRSGLIPDVSGVKPDLHLGKPYHTEPSPRLPTPSCPARCRRLAILRGDEGRVEKNQRETDRRRDGAVAFADLQMGRAARR